MIRLLDPTDPADVALFEKTLNNIASQDHAVYYGDGMQMSFEKYVKLFSTVETNPAKQFYVSVEIVDDQVVRMMVLSTMNKLWTRISIESKVHYFALVFWYTAPGYTKENPYDNDVGRLAFDKFINQGMFTFVALMKGPKTKAGLRYYQNKMFKKIERFNVYIDYYIDSQEKLEQLKESIPWFSVLLPFNYKNPMILYTGIIKPEFRQYDNF
jgi:predicted amino acid-binding ACT domain protein